MKSRQEEIKIIPAKPESLSATIGELAGEIDLNWDAVKDARSYVVEVSKNRKDCWQQVDIVPVSKYTVSRLKGNSTYRFRIAVSDGNRQGPWSEVVTKKL
ncbi:MAG: fibronectin type III domain-containing protein [Ignavibacteria bacterium]